jgi:hypothetical protein
MLDLQKPCRNTLAFQIAAILGTICSSYQLFHIGFDGIQITTLIISIVLLVAAICLIKRLNNVREKKQKKKCRNANGI